MSFCGWAPCHAEDALCENTSCKMPSRKLISNVIILQGKPIDSCIATRMGWKPSALIFHFWILQVFFWLVAAWVKSRAERPSVSGVSRQLHVQIGCKLGIRNRKDELTKQAKRNELQINPISGSCRLPPGKEGPMATSVRLKM